MSNHLTSGAVQRAVTHRLWDDNVIPIVIEYCRNWAKPYGSVPSRYWDYISAEIEAWVKTISSRREKMCLKLDKYNEGERECILCLVEEKLGHVGPEGQIMLCGRSPNEYRGVDASDKGATREERLVYLKDKIHYELWLTLHISKFEDMWVEDEIKTLRHFFGLCMPEDECARCDLGYPFGYG